MDLKPICTMSALHQKKIQESLACPDAYYARTTQHSWPTSLIIAWYWSQSWSNTAPHSKMWTLTQWTTVHCTHSSTCVECYTVISLPATRNTQENNTICISIYIFEPEAITGSKISSPWMPRLFLFREQMLNLSHATSCTYSTSGLEREIGSHSLYNLHTILWSYMV